MPSYIEGMRSLITGAADDTTHIHTSRRVRDVSNEIDLLDPNDTALLTLLRRLRKKKSDRREVRMV